jgi:hypothetical protein
VLPRPTIEAFDIHLAGLDLRLDAVLIGGSALALLGITTRPTRDFDILVPDLSPAIVDAARDFARAQRRVGVDLGADWLNTGTRQVAELLPGGWQTRLQVAFVGRALGLNTRGRADLLKTKLFALCDRGTDLLDRVALHPTADELEEAPPWLTMQDANAEWPTHVRATMADLAGRLGHGV